MHALGLAQVSSPTGTRSSMSRQQRWRSHRRHTWQTRERRSTRPQLTAHTLSQTTVTAGSVQHWLWSQSQMSVPVRFAQLLHDCAAFAMVLCEFASNFHRLCRSAQLCKASVQHLHIPPVHIVIANLILGSAAASASKLLLRQTLTYPCTCRHTEKA